MKSEKPTEDGLIAVFVPELPNTPGWLKLSQAKRDALLQHTSHLQQYRQMQMLGEFGELMELTQVQQLIDGEEMKMGDYLQMIYPQHHDRTIFRKQKAFAELAATIPNPILKRIAEVGQDVLGKFDRIATAAMGNILNALRQMPLLPVNSDKDAERFMEDLNEKLGEERKARRKKGLVPDKGLAEKMAINALIHSDLDAKLQTSAERRQFLTRVVGWYMEAKGVHGIIRACRIPIPDGIIIRRGRPRKHHLKEEA